MYYIVMGTIIYLYPLGKAVIAMYFNMYIVVGKASICTYQASGYLKFK